MVFSATGLPYLNPVYSLYQPGRKVHQVPNMFQVPTGFNVGRNETVRSKQEVNELVFVGAEG